MADRGRGGGRSSTVVHTLLDVTQVAKAFENLKGKAVPLTLIIIIYNYLLSRDRLSLSQFTVQMVCDLQYTFTMF